MKKIISLITASAMALSMSMTAFAGTVVYPTGYAPKANITVSTGETPNASGLYTTTVTIDLSDLGELNCTTEGSGIRINSLSIDLRADKDMAVAKFGNASGNLGATSLGQTVNYTGADASGMNIVYYAGDGFAAYPTEEGVTTDECTGAISFRFRSYPGTITFSNATVSYLSYEDGDPIADYENAIADLTLNQATFSIAQEETASLALTADLIGHYADRGYIWNANVTKGEGDITGFNVSFTAPEGTKTGAIQNIDALTNKYTGAEFTFQVGLKTTKNLTSAAFSITDTNGTVEAPTVPVE